MVEETLQNLLDSHDVGALLSGQILLVDDEVQNLAVLERVLEDDYTVHVAESGAEALEVVKRVPLDIVIADQRMPGMTGVDLLETIRKDKPDIAGIVLTAYTDSPAIMAAINRAAAFRFLTKPWNPNEILFAVQLANEHVFHRRAVQRLVEILARRNEDLATALTNLKETQGQIIHLERLGTMGRLTAGITHDLRSLLSGLVLVENELAEAYHDAEGSENNHVSDLSEILRVMSAGTRNLLDTLQALNEFARGGPMHISTSAIFPEVVVNDALTVMRMDLEFRRRDLSVTIEPNLPKFECDRRRLSQVLVNLLRNATHATQPSQSINVIAATGPREELVLAVEDDGPGVPDTLKGELFDPFVTTNGQQGMGMGLYMARLIMESHGGRIRCLDRSSGGTRFELILERAAGQ